MAIETMNQTSSMGVDWPPRPASFERLRGFDTEGVIRTETDSAAFADLFALQRARFDELPDTTRLSLRFIAHTGQLATLHAMGVPLEAAVPLFNTEPGLCIVYAGVNAYDRQPSEDELSHYQTLLADVRNHPRRESTSEGELAARGMQAHTVDHARANELVDSFLPLYSAFGYSAAEIGELLENPRNHIVYITEGNTVVSTAMVEVNDVYVAGLGTLTLGEVTDAFTLPDHRRRGLYRLASYLAVEKLRQERGVNLHGLYGESNLASPGVLYAGIGNGRELSGPEQVQGRIPNFGMLPGNVRVEDGQGSVRYNDFAVTYFDLSN